MQHQTYKTIHAKPKHANLFQTIYKTEPTNPNLPNQTYHTNQHCIDLFLLISVFVTICVMWQRLHGFRRGCVIIELLIWLKQSMQGTFLQLSHPKRKLWTAKIRTSLLFSTSEQSKAGSWDILVLFLVPKSIVQSETLDCDIEKRCWICCAFGNVFLKKLEKNKSNSIFSRTKMKVDKIIPHENFNLTSIDKANDIALLRLGDIT